MKKILSLMLALLMLTLAACGGGSGDSNLVPPEISGNAGQSAAKVTIEPVVLLEQDGIKIQAKELEMDSLFGPELKILIENETDKDLTVQCRNSSVNGYMVETMLSTEVAAGKKANDAVTFLSADLERCGIETVADMEFSFHIFTTEDWETYLDSDVVQIKTSAAEGYDYSYDHPGTLVYEGKGVKVIAKGLSNDNIFGPGVVMYVQNTGSKAVTVQARSTSVNGFMIEPLFSQDIMPGKHAVSEMTFMESQLEENGITQIDEVELSLHIFDSDSWKTIADTETVKLTFK